MAYLHRETYLILRAEVALWLVLQVPQMSSKMLTSECSIKRHGRHTKTPGPTPSHTTKFVFLERLCIGFQGSQYSICSGKLNLETIVSCLVVKLKED